ncbi:PREDICTED: Fc receptor-like protein 1 isoform X4 [Hipposideros armiger]|uniref:Fc receptor-like protein 1 isoform X4 n=1 Tax=Hipposideros armiger TaxID=186990 RepID=A0A8B7QKP6_HIPAR|nr:PREDICTED: Fc receptor-like protein 1 isoform X4 [Hipposideros armiger]
MLLRLLTLLCALLCEPTALLLKVSPPRPVDGNPMTLTCESQFARPEPHLQFRFMRHSQVLGRDWDNSSQLQVAAVWSGDTGVYWCEAKTAARRTIRSGGIWIQVQRVPVGNVRLETQPPGGHVAEGEKLVLVCSVTQATGDISFLWYRGALGLNLETKTQRSLTAKLEIPAVRESDADQYYCAADNGHGPSISTLVNIVVTIPVSRPGLTLSTPGAQALVGDTVELHCEAQRGSPPILYRFYCNDVTLGSSSAPSGGGVSFNLSLTAEHSGNYSCEADNGLRAQRSELVPLRVTGRPSASDPVRCPPLPPPRESTYLNTATPEQRQPVYENVNVVRGDEVYSLAYCVQQEWQPAAAEPLRSYADDRDSSVIYSGVKKMTVTDVDYENDI